jgi:uncharacterized membrane protein
MKPFFYFPLLGLILFLSLLTGIIAKSQGQHFFTWFAVALIPSLIVACLYFVQERLRRKMTTLCAVQNEELFDHLFIGKDQKSSMLYRKPSKRQT